MTNEEFIKNISFEGEEWRDIKDFEGLYMISSCGRILSCPKEVMGGNGYIHRDLKLSDRVWTCPECGAVNDRDLLAANNIKKFGLEKQNLLTQ